MKVDSIELKNFRGFRQAKLSLHPGCNVIIGINGTGKTALLEGLKISIGSLMLGMDKVKERLYSPGIDKRLDVHVANTDPEWPTPLWPVEIITEGTILSKSIRWSRSLSGFNNTTTYKNADSIRQCSEMIQDEVREGKTDIILPLISFYNTDRFKKNKTDDKGIEPYGTRLRGYYGAVAEQTNLDYFLRLFRTETLGSLQEGTPSPLLAIVENAITTCIPDFRKIYHHVKMDQLETLILDEADKMLDMGFYEDIMTINQFLPIKKQILLFSATMPVKIRPLAKKLLQNPVEINIAVSKPAAGVDQKAYVVFDDQKNNLIVDILASREITSTLIFASTKIAVKTLEKELQKRNLPAAAIHSDLTQENRESVLLNFKNRKTPILIATDILSRGIDIDNIGIVINYDVPGDAEDYVHRVGRTARAETTGEAITFISPKDQARFVQIEEFIEMVIPKIPLPESLGKAPEWNPSLKIKSNFGKRKNFSNKNKSQKKPDHKTRN